MVNHPQVKLWYAPAGAHSAYSKEVEVDEKLAPFLELLWKNGVKTMMSCQDTPHPGRNDNSSCGRVWISFPSPKDATKFLKLCVPHPPTTNFAPESLYNRVYIHWFPDHWPRSNKEEVVNTPVDFKLWTWNISLSDINFDMGDAGDDWTEEDCKFTGSPRPDFSVSVRFSFDDIEELTQNISEFGRK